MNKAIIVKDLYKFYRVGDSVVRALDGVNFEEITDNGFGDPYNHGLRVFATTEDYMFIGTANPFMGTQIWRTDGEAPASNSGSNNVVNIITSVGKLINFLRDIFFRYKV